MYLFISLGSFHRQLSDSILLKQLGSRIGVNHTSCCPGGTSGKELDCQCRRPTDTGSIPGSGRSPGGGNGNHSSFLAWRIPGQRSLVGYSPWGSQELDTTDHTLYILAANSFLQPKEKKTQESVVGVCGTTELAEQFSLSNADMSSKGKGVCVAKTAWMVRQRSTENSHLGPRESERERLQSSGWMGSRVQRTEWNDNVGPELSQALQELECQDQSNFLQLALLFPAAHSLLKMRLSLFPSHSTSFSSRHFHKTSLRFANRNISPSLLFPFWF